MDGHYFVSYSRIDGEEYAGRLANQLVGGRPSYPVWLDTRDMQPGADWDEQITDAIQTCRGVLFVMTADSVQDHSVCKSEWVWALKYKKPVIPLRLDAGASLPFRLSSREYIDFSGGFEIGLARLRVYLDSVGTPRWVLRELRDQLAEAERELRRTDPERRARVEQDVADLGKRITDQRLLVADPEAAARRTEERITVGLDQERHLDRPKGPPARARFVNTPPVAAPRYFQDRHVETELVGDFLRSASERIMTVVGRGGVGKTSMVCRLLKSLEGGVLPDDLGELDVDGIVYLSPAGEHPVNFPNLFADLCRLLPQQAADRLMQRYRDPGQTPAALMLALLDAFPDGRVVVLLDQAEDIINAADDDFPVNDAALDEALRALLNAPVHAVKVIVTTRVAPRALLLVQPERQRRLDLDQGLPSPYAEQVLRARDPDGRLGLKTAPDELLGQARQRTRGYPRALEALAAILAADRDTTLPELLAETTRLPDNVVEVLVGQAFNRLDPLAQQVMQALSVFPAPVPPVAVDYLLQAYRPAVDAAPVLRRLVNTQFVRREAGRYYLHQVDRDYALSRIPPGGPADRVADPPPFTQSALRHRGASYFEQTRAPREDWRSLDDLAPLLNEFELRFQGADYDAAAGVVAVISFDYLLAWGHYRLITSMHERLMGRLEDAYLAALGMNMLGLCYWQLGRITEGIELHQRALAAFREIGDRWGEFAALANLGSCHYLLAHFTEATELAEQAVAMARAGGHRRDEGIILGNLSLCYHAVGDFGKAVRFCEEGLAIARETGDREREASGLDNLARCHLNLGRPAEAIRFVQQALAIGREFGFRADESLALSNMADIQRSLGAWERAAECARQAIEMADAIGHSQAKAESRLSLAQVRLLSGDPGAALEPARAAHANLHPLTRTEVCLVLGITRLRLGETAAAAQDFRDTVADADDLLRHTANAYAQLNARALALCGLALTTDPGLAATAIGTFRAARAATTAQGVVQEVLALFDALAVADSSGILAAVRPAAAGES